MDIKTLISECTAYDYKLMLEENKPKSWLKSVSAFANGLGGSLFYGVNNEGVVKGLDNVQHVCETVRSTPCARTKQRKTIRLQYWPIPSRNVQARIGTRSTCCRSGW